MVRRNAWANDVSTYLRLGPWHGLQRHVKNVQMDAGHVFRHALNRFAR
jgi:hypothetical protein